MLPGGWVVHAIAGRAVRRLLVSMFERRHAITRASLEATPSNREIAGHAEGTGP
jgi:hypothetical protein